MNDSLFFECKSLNYVPKYLYLKYFSLSFFKYNLKKKYANFIRKYKKLSLRKIFGISKPIEKIKN